MSMVKDIFVSAVIVIKPHDRQAEAQLTSIQKILSEHYAHYELLVMDSESQSNEFASEMESILKKLPKVRYIRLFNIMSDKVLFAAGMENAIGDIVVASYLPCFSEGNIVQAVDLCCAGNDLVSGVSSSRKPFLLAFGGFLFRTLFGKMVHYQLPKNDLPFRCVSRRLINAAMNMDHFHEFVFLRLSNAGGKHAEFTVDNDASNYGRDSLGTAFSKAISMLIFNTTTPLRIINGLALASSFLALVFALYTIAVRLLKNHVVEGWTTMMLVISILFFMLFLILSFIGEYLVRLITDHGKREPYNVIFEKHSSVMLDFEKLNIREDSVSSEINLTQTGRDR